MLGGGGGDGGQQNQNPVARLLVSSMAALVMSVLMIVLYSSVPQHEPRLFPNGPRHPKIVEGLWEQKDFFGLIDTQWNLRGGLAEGEALQYHSNGSLFRELVYRNGKLDGPLREYFEKGPYRRAPIRGRLASPAERAQCTGVLRRAMEYRSGVPIGKYEVYYPSGVLKEEGEYRDGAKKVLGRYQKDGRPKKGFFTEESWTPKR